MNNFAGNRIVDNYFRFMKDWDTNTKKDLIIKLTDSINVKAENKNDFSLFFGAWDDSRSAEEIINELEAERINQKEIEGF